MDIAALKEKMPRKVWIGNFEFRLAFGEWDQLPLKDAEGEYDGDTDFDTQLITLRSNMTLPIFLETTIHELTHAVDFAGDIEDGVLEEFIADKHGKLWSQFWVNNPRFQRWWTSACVALRRERQGGSTVKEKK